MDESSTVSMRARRARRTDATNMVDDINRAMEFHLWELLDQRCNELLDYFSTGGPPPAYRPDAPDMTGGGLVDSAFADDDGARAALLTLCHVLSTHGIAGHPTVTCYHWVMANGQYPRGETPEPTLGGE